MDGLFCNWNNQGAPPSIHHRVSPYQRRMTSQQYVPPESQPVIASHTTVSSHEAPSGRAYIERKMRAPRKGKKVRHNPYLHEQEYRTDDPPANVRPAPKKSPNPINPANKFDFRLEFDDSLRATKDTFSDRRVEGKVYFETLDECKDERSDFNTPSSTEWLCTIDETQTDTKNKLNVKTIN